MPLAHAHMNGKLLDGSFLWADTLVCGVVRTFSDRLDSLFLARGCRDLEEEMGATRNFTSLLGDTSKLFFKI